MMLSKYMEKNKYGGYTWEIKWNPLFKILIHESDTTTHIVEFNEWKWLRNITRFTFISNEDLKTTIIIAFDRVYDFFINSSQYSYTKQQKEREINEVFQELQQIINILGEYQE